MALSIQAEECFLRPKNGSDNGFADGGYEWKPYSCRYDVMDAKTRTACMREKNVTRFLDVGDRCGTMEARRRDENHTSAILLGAMLTNRYISPTSPFTAPSEEIKKMTIKMAFVLYRPLSQPFYSETRIQAVRAGGGGVARYRRACPISAWCMHG